MLKAGIIGAAGYAGAETARLLMGHTNAEIEYISSRDKVGRDLGDIYPCFGRTGHVFEEDDWDAAARRCDVVFAALPNGIACEKITAARLEKTRFIDLSADFRLKNAEIYEKWYGLEHKGPELLKDAVYGLCEINRAEIKKARIVANPGCYTTCAILALYPLLAENIIDPSSVIIDAKSGVSGAGRGLSQDLLFCEVNENVKAYKIASHRHTPELDEQLSYACGQAVITTFTPHLIPMNRGILATSYANVLPNIQYYDIKRAYEKWYKNEHFVRLCRDGDFPETRRVKDTNFADIAFALDERTRRVIAVSAIDNLVKGAAGQAVQNMNIMFDFDEKTGLERLSGVTM